MKKETIEYRDPTTLKPWPGNARTHSKKQISQIADSIRCFGFTNPVLIDEHDVVLAGHGRIKAAIQLAIDTVPCLPINRMSPAQKRAYVIADNKLALEAGWDEDLLAIELQGLLDDAFDVNLTGFSIPEIDSLIDGLNPEESGDPTDDLIPDPTPGSPITRTGDIWILGPHRVLCGDARSGSDLDTLMGNEWADMVFTDPPYNVPVNGHVCGSGSIHHREFIMASGEMSSATFTAFLRDAFQNMVAHSVDGAIHFVCMDWRHMREILDAGEQSYSELKNLIVWAKDNGGMGSFYRSRHELVFAFKAGVSPHINNFELGQHGRYRTNIWEYKGVNTLRAGRLDDLSVHPTVKPAAMVGDAIRDVSARGGIVLDCFGGSGSTLIAAHKTGRKARIIELDPTYVDVIVRRWQITARDHAVLAQTGLTFVDTEQERKIGTQTQSRASTPDKEEVLSHG